MTQEEKYLIHIKPSKGWQSLNIRELWQYKDLIYFLALRGIKAKYAQSVLGILWAIIQPLSQVVIFTVIFGNLAKLHSDNIPYTVFSLAGLVPWNYFSGIVSESTNSLVQNKNILSKVYFPRLVFPISTILSQSIDFIISFLFMLSVFFYFGFFPNRNIYVLPFLLLILLLSALGLGLILSALAIQYRDVKYAANFLLKILLYGIPVVYSIDIIPKTYTYLYALNPLVGVIEGIRSIFLATKPIPWDLIFLGFIVAILLLLVGVFYFQKMEKSFADIA